MNKIVKQALAFFLPLSWIWIMFALGFALRLGTTSSPRWWEIPFIITGIVGMIASLIVSINIAISIDE